MSEYRTWDREEKLGPPPWNANDPAVLAWEEAHGHDVRLKCYSEFCQLVEPELEQRAEKAEAAARVFQAKLQAIANAVAVSEPELVRSRRDGVTVFFPDPVWFTIQTAADTLAEQSQEGDS